MLGWIVYKVLISSDDVVLSFRLMQRLKQMNIQFELLEPHHTIPQYSIVFTDHPQHPHPQAIFVDVHSIEQALEQYFAIVHKIDEDAMLIIGIDPGPRPACAWRTNKQPVDAHQCESVDDLFSFLTKLSRRYNTLRIKVRVGNGSPVDRDRIINRCFSRGYLVEEVDEKATSRGPNRHDHTKAAIRISMKAGKSVFLERIIEPSKGFIRNIQRESRVVSGGKTTISSLLAKKVALGELSIEEALEQ